jgi:hypothetical protein
VTYSPTVWQDLPSTATPVDATKMNKLEQGLVAASARLLSYDTTGAAGASAALQALIDAGARNIVIPPGRFLCDGPVFYDQQDGNATLRITAHGVVFVAGSGLPTVAEFDAYCSSIGVATGCKFFLFPSTLRTALSGGVVTGTGNDVPGTATFPVARNGISPHLVVDGGTFAASTITADNAGFVFGNVGGASELRNVHMDSARTLLSWAGYVDANKMINCAGWASTNLSASNDAWLFYQIASGDGVYIYGCKNDNYIGLAALDSCNGAHITATVGAFYRFRNSHGITVDANHTEVAANISVVSRRIYYIRDSHVTINTSFDYLPDTATDGAVFLDDSGAEGAHSTVHINNYLARDFTTTSDPVGGFAIYLNSMNDRTKIYVRGSSTMVSVAGVLATAYGQQGLTIGGNATNEPTLAAALAAGRDIIGSGDFTIYKYKTSAVPTGQNQAMSIGIGTPGALAGLYRSRGHVAPTFYDAESYGTGTLTNGQLYAYAAAVCNTLPDGTIQYGQVTAEWTQTAPAGGAQGFEMYMPSAPNGATLVIWRKTGTGVLAAPDRYVVLPVGSAASRFIDTGANLSKLPWITTSVPVPNTVAATNHTAEGLYLGTAIIAPVPVPSGLSAAGSPSATTFLRGDGSWATPAGGGGASSAAALRWFDTKDYGAKSDLTRGDDAAITAASATIPGSTFSGTATDVGKLIRIQGAGAVLFSGTDGAMTSGAAATNNRFTSAGSAFTTAVIGRWLVVDRSPVFKARIIGVESGTQLRLATPAPATFSGQTWRIAEDHYTTISTSTAGVSAVVAAAPITAVASAIIWYGTDDSAAIQAAVNDAEAVANLGGTGNAVYHFGASMIGTAIYLQKPTQLIGAGSRGYSQGQGHGRSRLMLGKVGIRGVVGGGSDTGMGVNGAMTSGTAVLTDPNGNFPASGMAGKNIIVYMAGTQTGSSLGFFLNTTIVSRDSATQLTLAANAGTTVTGAIYTYSTTAGYNGGLVGPSVKNLHVEGGPGQLAGVHLMNCSESIVEEVCCSDFGSGVGHFMDPGPSVGFSNQSEYRSCYATNSRFHFKHDRGTVIFTGNCFVDGNDNRVDCNIPEGMTVGIDGNAVENAGYVKIQAIGTGVRSSGRGGAGNVTGTGFDFENFQVMFDLASDGGTGGHHHYVGFGSGGNSNAGGGHGIRLRAGARAKLVRGYSLDGDIVMYDLVDSTAQLSVLGERVEKSGAVSDADFVNTPYDGAEGLDRSTGTLYKRIGGSWDSFTSGGGGGGSGVGFTTVAVQASDLSVTSQTTPQDTSLAFVFGAGATEIWWWEAMLLIAPTNATSDVKVGAGVTGGAGATQSWGLVGTAGSGQNGFHTVATSSAAPALQGPGFAGFITVGSSADAGGHQGIQVAGWLFGAGAGGTWKLQFAQNTSDANPLVLKTGSFLRAMKLQ